MNTLIVYASTHGCTEKCAHKLASQLPNSPTVVNLKKSARIDLNDFETVVIGGSIHAGRMQAAVRKFCQKNLSQLKQKRIGLFVCCMEENEKAQQQFDEAFPSELLEQAIAKGFFGGEFDFDKMNFIVKAIIKKMANVDHSVSKIAEDEIGKFAAKIANPSA